jgi:hypothetical protein
MKLNINREEIALRVLEELESIAFSDEVKTNHKLTALRLLIKLLSLDKPDKSEESDGVVIVDDMFGDTEHFAPVGEQREKQVSPREKQAPPREKYAPSGGGQSGAAYSGNLNRDQFRELRDFFY